MNGNLTIRPGRREDQPRLLDIVWATVMESERDREELLARPELVEVPVEHVTAGTCVVAEIEGTPVGFATVLPRPDGDAELDGLFVLPGMQRLGLGRALVQGASDLGLAMGASALHVIANDDALHFYRAIGFEQHGMAPTTLRPAPAMRKALR